MNRYCCNSGLSYLYEDRVFLAKIIVSSIILYFLVSISWPLFPGRDFRTYIMYFLQAFSNETVHHMLMLYRTPVASLFLGGLFYIGGEKLVFITMAIIYAMTFPAYYYIGSIFGRNFSRIFTLIMLMYISGNIFAHEISSDIVFHFLLVFWVAFLVNVYRKTTTSKLAVLGFLAFMLILTRPQAQLFVIFTILPIVLYGFKWQKIKKYSVYLLVITVGILVYSSYNYFRYGDFTVSRGANLQIPGYKVFVKDKIMHYSNGPISKELGEAVSRNLLDKEPYKSFNIDIETFFSCGNTRMFFDLANLSDRTWGWNDNYVRVRGASIEAIKQHPWIYVKSGILDICKLFFYEYIPLIPKKARILDRSTIKKSNSENNIANAKLTEGQLIPRAYVNWFSSSPENIKVPKEKRIELSNKVDEVIGTFPARSGSEKLSRFLYKMVIKLFPVMGFFLILSLLLFFNIREVSNRFIVFLLFFSLLNIFIITFSQNNIVQFRIPFDFIFILAGLSGLRLYFTSLLSYLTKNILIVEGQRYSPKGSEL